MSILNWPLTSWANEIRKLVEIDGVSIQRVETALDWYEENIGGQYIPVIESGSSLRNKFIKLEDAMRRVNWEGWRMDESLSETWTSVKTQNLNV